MQCDFSHSVERTRARTHTTLGISPTRPSQFTRTAINNVKSFYSFSSTVLFFSARENASACFPFSMLRELMRCMCSLFLSLCTDRWFCCCFFWILYYALLHLLVHNSVWMYVGMSRITNTLFKLFKNSRTFKMRFASFSLFRFGWLLRTLSHSVDSKLLKCTQV